MNRWFCVVCGYVHEGETAPDVCPVCGVGPDQFELITPKKAEAAAAGPARILVVGNGVAGHAAAMAARRAAPDAGVRIIAAESHHHYNRVGLSPYLAGVMPPERLSLATAETYREQRIETHLGDPVVEFEMGDEKFAITQSGERFGFDRLVLCNGASAFVPPIPGMDGPGVHVLRTKDDADALAELAAGGPRVAVLGGGLLGLEAAYAMTARGAQSATVIEGAQGLMPRQLDEESGQLLAERVAQLGIDIRLGELLEGVDRAENGSLSLRFSDDSLDVDLLIVATGIRPELGLAEKLGLDIGRGVAVDAAMKTSKDDIWAAGDVAEMDGAVFGLWNAAMAMGAVAGANAAGADERADAVSDATFLKVVGIPVFSAGLAAFPPPGAVQFIEIDEDTGKAQQIVTLEGRVVGGALVGDASRAMALRTAIENQADVSDRIDEALTTEGDAFALLLDGL